MQSLPILIVFSKKNKFKFVTPSKIGSKIFFPCFNCYLYVNPFFLLLIAFVYTTNNLIYKTLRSRITVYIITSTLKKGI